MSGIDKTYDKWNKFENFLKFASKKEVRDRLKEFDAPDLANYIDPDTIDKINKTHKAPPFVPGRKQSKGAKNEKTSKEIKDENRKRIMKMKELYGMFVQMEKDNDDRDRAECNE